LVRYANEHGDPRGRPYFSVDGRRPVTRDEWAALRDAWRHQHALTNVWAHPPLAGVERYRGNGKRSAPRVHRPGKQATVHLNQKPLEFMRRIPRAGTRKGDVVWEPFGGLCSAAVAAASMRRVPYAAECVDEFHAVAARRLEEVLAARFQGPSK